LGQQLLIRLAQLLATVDERDALAATSFSVFS